jgi:hypothetical protein
MVGAGMVEIPAGRFRMGSVGFYPEEGPVREAEVVSRSTAGRLRSRGLPGLLRRPGIGRSPSGHRRPLTTRTPTPCCWSRDRRCFVPLPTPFHSIQRSAWKVNSPKSAYSFVLRTSPQNRKARSLAHPHSTTHPYMLGLGSIYGIVNAPLPHNLIPTTQVLQPVLQPG